MRGSTVSVCRNMVQCSHNLNKLCIVVLAQPPVITKAPTDVIATENDRATFECQATANPRPSLSWRKLDKTPLPRVRSTISSNNTLTITNLRTLDEGSYVCEAENVFGVTHAYATLAVQGILSHHLLMDQY